MNSNKLTKEVRIAFGSASLNKDRVREADMISCVSLDKLTQIDKKAGLRRFSAVVNKTSQRNEQETNDMLMLFSSNVFTIDLYHSFQFQGVSSS